MVNKAFLLDLASGLVTALKQGNDQDVHAILEKLTIERELSLLVDIGKLTRALHSALLNVHHVNPHLDTRLTEIAEHDIPDARGHLDYVISRTEHAAHRTLSAIEDLLPIADNISASVDEILEDCSTLGLTNPQGSAAGPVSDPVKTFFSNLKSDSQFIHARLSDVLIAQDYQDLTGQVIRRVIEVFQNVEKKLVDLLLDLRKHQRTCVPAKGQVQAEYYTPTTTRDEDHVVNQDEVDSLLSSLGF